MANGIERLLHAVFIYELSQLHSLRVILLLEAERRRAPLHQIRRSEAVPVCELGRPYQAVIGLKLANRVAPYSRDRVHQRRVREARKNFIDESRVVKRAPVLRLQRPLSLQHRPDNRTVDCFVGHRFVDVRVPAPVAEVGADGMPAV